MRRDPNGPGEPLGFVDFLALITLACGVSVVAVLLVLFTWQLAS